MPVDPNKTALMFFAVPDGYVRFEAMAWAYKRLPWKKVGVHVGDDRPRDIVASANDMVKTTLRQLRKDTEWVIFMDHDMRPTTDSDALWNQDADLIGVRYETARGGASWSADTAIHSGFFCARVEALRRIDPPYFAFGRSEDGTAIESCMCHLLRKKALDAGLSIVNCGWAEHLGAQSWRH